MTVGTAQFKKSYLVQVKETSSIRQQLQCRPLHLSGKMSTREVSICSLFIENTDVLIDI